MVGIQRDESTESRGYSEESAKHETETRVQHEGIVRECSCQSTILESSARVHRVERIESRVQCGRQSADVAERREYGAQN